MMSIKHGYYFLAAIVLAAFSPLANSAPAVCDQTSHNGYSGEFDGRFYQVVVAGASPGMRQGRPPRQWNMTGFSGSLQRSIRLRRTNTSIA